MKKNLHLAVFFAILLCTVSLFGCGDANYEDKILEVKISHTSGFYTEDPYYKYYNIEIDKTYSLPKGDSNPYGLEFTLSEANSNGVTLLFSRSMLLYDKTEKKWNETTRVTLKQDEQIEISTPTDGGTDSFVFSIIERDGCYEKE